MLNIRHIGVISTNDPNALLLSTSFWTGGESGTAVGNVKFDEMWEADGSPYFYVYRQTNSKPANVTHTKPVNVTHTKPAPKGAIGKFKANGNAFTAYNGFRVDEIKQVNGIWQAINYGLAGGRNFNWVKANVA